MEENETPNPLMDSVYFIAKQEVAHILWKHYLEITKKNKDNPQFETGLAEVAAEILEFKSKCKEGTTTVEAGLILALPLGPDPDDPIEVANYDPDYEKECGKVMHAAIVYLILKNLA